MYDFYYQSNADTPFVEKDLHQHTLQTSLEITVRNQYPLRLTFNTAKGNSAYFRNITGANLKYDQRDFRNLLISRVIQWDRLNIRQLKLLDSLKSVLDTQWADLRSKRKWFDGDYQVRKRIEAREAELYGKAVSKLPTYTFKGGQLEIPAWADSVNVKRKLPGDTTYKRFLAEYEQRKHQLDSLEQVFVAAEKTYRDKLQHYNDKKQQVQDLLKNSRDNRELADRLGQLRLPDTVLPKGYRTLLAVRSVGIGRSLADYSELTVKNISITGFQIEYNPSYYVAFATGAVDYRFRDFSVSAGRIKQYVSLARVGLGQRDGHHLYLTYYTGKKQLYNINTLPADSVGGNDRNVMGVALEGRWQLGRNISITGEAAKSSMPYYRRAASKESVPGSMLTFNDRSNEAYSVTAEATVPVSATRVQGMFRSMGADFQSFSFYNSGSSQNAWMLKADQPFFKQQLVVTGAVRKNVFSSQFEHGGYESNTVFKSIQATFRRGGWPVVSVGYFPTSQLMKLDNERLMENVFYTLNGTVNHFYQYKDISMNTMFSGTRFYNKQDDTAFVYFNSTNLVLNQTVFLGAFTLSGGLSSAFNPEYDLHGVDGNLQYRASWFELGGGLKYNYQTIYGLQQLGYNGNVRVNIPKIGEIALMGDRSFIPGVNKRLVPNETGRLTYTKIF